MISKIISFINSNQLISKGDVIIAAVSGGLDSMAMLFCLHSIKTNLNFKLEAIHVNHGIRGEASDGDEALVKKVCEELGVTVHTRKLSGFNINSSEDDLRQARYEIFNKLHKKNSKTKIATAHTLDDQLETFLMRLAKGSKLKGLCGIPVKRDAFIRPLLFLRKNEIEEYVKLNKIEFREDYTNKDITKTRNNIRLKIIPIMLEVFGSQFYSSFAESSKDLNNSQEIIKRQVDSYFNQIAKKNDDRIKINLSQFCDLPFKMRHLLIEYCVSMYYPLNFGIPSGNYQEFDFFAEKASIGASFCFQQNLKVTKNRDNLFFTILKSAQQKELELYPGGVVYKGRNKIALKEVVYGEIELTNNKNIEYICGDRLNFPLIIREWQKGDFFFPLGLTNKQKLSDFFINEKIDLNEKEKIPIIVNNSEIVWVVGHRIDNRYKFDRSSNKIYELILTKSI